MPRLAMLRLLLLPAVVDAFGGLNYVRRSFNATVFRQPGEQPIAYGWDQTKDSPLAATAVIGNTRINVWKWDLPPPVPPPAPPRLRA